MGNRLNAKCYQPTKENITVLTNNGGVLEFKAPAKVKKITSGAYIGYQLVHHSQPCSPLPPNSKLQPGEVYYLVADLAAARPKITLVSPKLDSYESSKRQRVKIVLTREQLELLLISASKLGAQEVSFGPQKWRTSLAPIEEVNDF